MQVLLLFGSIILGWRLIPVDVPPVTFSRRR